MTKQIWKSVSNVSMKPQNAREIEELSSESLETPVAIADSVRVYIEFEAGDKQTLSLDEQISRVSKELMLDDSFYVRRKDEAGYAITADVSSADLHRLEKLSFISSVKVMDEAVLTNELKKNQETDESLADEIGESVTDESESNEYEADEATSGEEVTQQEKNDSYSTQDIFSTECVTEAAEIQKETLANNDDSKTTSNFTTMGIVAVIAIALVALLLNRHNKK